MPSPRLAPSVFISGPSDDLAAPDIYTGAPSTVPASPIAQAEDPTATAATVALANQKTGQVAAPTTPTSIVPPTSAQATSRLQSVTGGASSPIGSFKTQLTQALQKAMGVVSGVTGGAGSKLIQGAGNFAKDVQSAEQKAVLTFNSISTKIDDAYIEGANDVTNLLSTVIDDGTSMLFTDTGAQHAVYSALLSVTSGLALDAMGSIIDKIVAKMGNNQAAALVLLGLLPTFVSNSDLVSIGRTVTVAGAPAVLGVMPDIITRIISHYRMPTSGGLDYPTMEAALTGVLASINPNWYQYNRNGVWLDQLDVFANCSADAKTLFSNGTNFYVHVTIAAQYPAIDLLTFSQGWYPAAVINP